MFFQFSLDFLFAGSVILKTPNDSVLHLSATMTSADFCAFSITLCNGYLFQGVPHRPP